jgi:hypothetical protein
MKARGDRYGSEVASEGRQPRYFLQKPSGELIFVSEVKEEGYPSSNLFIGFGPTLRKVHIDKKMMMRDGGTTILGTAIGELTVPTPWEPKAAPVWTTPSGKEISLVKLDPSRASFDEKANFVTVRKLDSFGLLSELSAKEVLRQMKISTPTLARILVVVPNDHGFYVSTPTSFEQLSILMEALYDLGVPRASSVWFEQGMMGISWVR